MSSRMTSLTSVDSDSVAGAGWMLRKSSFSAGEIAHHTLLQIDRSREFAVRVTSQNRYGSHRLLTKTSNGRWSVFLYVGLGVGYGSCRLSTPVRPASAKTVEPMDMTFVGEGGLGSKLHQIPGSDCNARGPDFLPELCSTLHKKLSYRRVTARCVVSVEILPITTQQCRNYLYDKS